MKKNLKITTYTVNELKAKIAELLKTRSGKNFPACRFSTAAVSQLIENMTIVLFGERSDERRKTA